MQPRGAAVEERLAELRGLLDADAAHRGGIVADRLELLGEPRRKLRTLHLGHALHQAKARDRHDPGDHGLVDPERMEALDEVEVVPGVEEELRDREVGLAELLGGVATVGLDTLRTWVRLRVRGDADREVAVLANEADEIDRVRELARREVEVLRRVAAQGEDVLDPRVAVARDDLRRAGRACARHT